MREISGTDYLDFDNLMPPRTGCILLSNPFMPDPHFRRSVVFLAEHSDEGSLGFVINKPIEVSLGALLNDFSNFDIPLRYGGPVQWETLHFLHRVGHKLEGSMQVADGIYWGGEIVDLIDLLRYGMVDPDDFVFFLGYSGWSASQLKNEIDSYSWLATDCFPEDLFCENPSNLWRDILRRMGDKYAVIANFPEDPRWN